MNISLEGHKRFYDYGRKSEIKKKHARPDVYPEGRVNEKIPCFKTRPIQNMVVGKKYCISYSMWRLLRVFSETGNEPVSGWLFFSDPAESGGVLLPRAGNIVYAERGI